jgi:hypothetical protein
MNNSAKIRLDDISANFSQLVDIMRGVVLHDKSRHAPEIGGVSIFFSLVCRSA